MSVSLGSYPDSLATSVGAEFKVMQELMRHSTLRTTIDTVIASSVAKRFGPVTSGLFLAFRTIFLAGANLKETHEKENRRTVGADGNIRG